MGSDSGKLRGASRQEVAARQGGVCPWCRLPLPEDLSGTELDHIIPRSRGGPDAIWNRQMLHKHCNRGPGGKGSQLTPEAEALAAEHGVVLHEPLPNAWPGSSVKLGSGKPNPYRAERAGGPPPHRATIRRFYEVKCDVCGHIVAETRTYGEAEAAVREHMLGDQVAG